MLLLHCCTNSYTDAQSCSSVASTLSVPARLPRLARMLRMMKEGGFGEAFATFDVIFKKNKKLVTTSAFVGLTTWLMLSSFNHIAERNNPDMLWIVSISRLLEYCIISECSA